MHVFVSAGCFFEIALYFLKKSDICVRQRHFFIKNHHHLEKNLF
ncbi:hypothetical protein SAMN05216311_113232 [Chitinophaga sp. CF418]|nr:hypothetical protein SAMN05216311_113232 [Chitinophaga sp. CF418]